MNEIWQQGVGQDLSDAEGDDAKIVMNLVS